MSRPLPRWVLRSGGLLTSLGSDYVLALFRGLASWSRRGRHRVYVSFVRSFVVCVMCPAVPAIACILSDSACSWGCISTSYLACDYARGRSLSWFLVSHDELCTILSRTIVLGVATPVC